MANTTIQLKYSTVTATPSSLNVAEPAYSYTSNTLFIGSPSGTGSIAIGGKFYLDQQAQIFNLVNAAFTTANAAGSSDLVVYAANHANAAFIQANSAATAASSAQGTADGAATAASNAQTAADAAQNSASASFNQANSAYTRANNSINANTGGTITGDLVITGNLTISGQTTYANTTAVQLGDNIITLNADIPTSLAPSENAGIEVNRGSALANASLLWNESAGKWQANTGSATGAFYLANEASTTSASNYANGAFVQANTAVSNALSASTYANTGITNALSASNYANAAFSLANGTAIIANTDYTNVNITTGDYGNPAYVSSFQVAANGRIISANSTAIAIGAGAITSGTLDVQRGGTGVGTHTQNGVLLGQGTNAIQTASSSTEGHILTINNSGVPTFSHLQGGTF